MVKVMACPICGDEIPVFLSDATGLAAECEDCQKTILIDVSEDWFKEEEPCRGTTRLE